MDKRNLKKALRVCEKMSQSLKDTEKVMFTWADEKEKLYEAYFKEMEKYGEIAREMPDEWHVMVSNQYAGGKIFSSPVRLKRFLKQNKRLVNAEERDIIRFFMENPWFYSLFSVEEIADKNFLRIHDYCTGTSFLLYSEGVYNAHREGKKLFLCLLFDNGECLQTYGLIIAFTGFTVEDIRCFARYTGHHFRNTGDLEAAISYNPIPYLLLSRFAERPAAMHENVPIVTCVHSLKVKDFSADEYKESFAVEEVDGVFKCLMKEDVGPFSFSCMYYDSRKQILLLRTSDLERYRSLAAGLKDSYDFPADPSWHVSVLMGGTLHVILGVQNPALEYEVLFTEALGPEEVEELEVMSAVVAELTEAHNTGLDFSLEETARKHNVPVGMVRELEEKLSGMMDKRFKIDIKGGFDDFTPLPPIERFVFDGTFRDNDLFRFSGSAKARKLFETMKPRFRDVVEDSEYKALTLRRLPRLLEEIFYNFSARLDYGGHYHIFLYTIYLLSKKGKTFHKAKDYAVEFLKAFWQIILPEASPKEINRFTRDYKFFCFEILYRGGLIDIDRELDFRKAKKTDYKIKTTEFFDQWIRFYKPG